MSGPVSVGFTNMQTVAGVGKVPMTQPVQRGVPLPVSFSGTEYETIAASQTAQALGASGAVGDYLGGLLIIPDTTGAGDVTIIDGSGGGAVSIKVFATGTLPSLAPIWVPLGLSSVVGGWHVTTGANVHVLAIGNFT